MKAHFCVAIEEWQFTTKYHALLDFLPARACNARAGLHSALLLLGRISSWLHAIGRQSSPAMVLHTGNLVCPLGVVLSVHRPAVLSLKIVRQLCL
jgi:hypothetical protein